MTSSPAPTARLDPGVTRVRFQARWAVEVLTARRQQGDVSNSRPDWVRDREEGGLDCPGDASSREEVPWEGGTVTCIDIEE
jgi:hypothetical protein